jgi:hypothetical protein
VAIQFFSPSQRASQSDLTVAISPIGLVELADEEFEVHGPRLNRYANNWAWYLGHHWSHRQAPGDPQLTFNYVKAFSDYITNFTFGKGVRFKTPEETGAIVPYLLDRAWHEDNKMEKVLWEIGNLGGVSGDVFVKVAYEDGFVDPAGMPHAGRVRILPMNPSQCFPEFHPHDRTRLIRFKLKYRFWGTDHTGTRQVYTYTELLTEESIEEFVNDELIDARANPLGRIPIVHIPNLNLSSSPWGLSDVQDITSLNREFNEKATEISDIINYHAAPVTVITGAKASQLERGAKKVWAGLPKDAKVFNLDSANPEVIAGPLQYLETVKIAMHELTGVPEGALGKMQPISNTSGVALSIMYQPLMNRHGQKVLQYGPGIERINELVLLTLYLNEPQTLLYDPVLAKGVEPKSNQYVMLDIRDPAAYRTKVDFPPPLPFDVLIKLNEIQGKMAMGLESKRGALRELGEEQPDQKMQEIVEELKRDALEQGALDLLRLEISLAQQASTGMMTDAAGAGGVINPADVASTGTGEDGNPVLPGPMLNPDPEVMQLAVTLNNMAYGTKLAQTRNPGSDND